MWGETMGQNAYVAILERAIESEIEAARFYANVAEKTLDNYLKEMFSAFSQEEQKHRRILEGFRSDPTVVIHFEKVSDFGVSETVPEPVLSIEMQPADAIALAMKKEEAAMRQYTQLAEACEDADQIKIFLELAAMEREHKAKLEAAFVDIGYPEVW
jgi:rubrerythrin